MVAIRALDVMKEGHDGSGVGLFLTTSAGFRAVQGGPILSGIFSNTGIKALDRYMMDMDFMTKYKLSFRPPSAPGGTPRRDNYLIRVYEYRPIGEPSRGGDPASSDDVPPPAPGDGQAGRIDAGL